MDVWNNLPEEVVMAPSLNTFKSRLNKCGKISPPNSNLPSTSGKRKQQNISKTKKLYKRAREANAYIGAGYSKHTVMSKSVRPKDLTDKISFGLTKN